MDELIQHDNITAAWFWVTSESTGPHSEREWFDVVFTRTTGAIVGGGYNARRTFYVQGIVTAQVQSRRENDGRIVRGDLAATLAQVITDAHEAGQYHRFQDWAQDCRDYGSGYLAALNDYGDWETLRTRHAALVQWLGQEDSDDYDMYVKAAQEYAAER